MWEKGKIEELPTFPGDPDGFVNAINDLGQAVGASGKCYTAEPGIHALLWEHGSITDLGNLGGTMNHFPQDINNQSQVVGFSALPNNATIHGFLWEDGVMTDLGTLPGDFWSFAFTINSDGQVVGQSCNSDFSVCRAFLWRNGVMTDLNSLISAVSPLSLLVAYTINDRGEIVGQASVTTGPHAGEIHAFLATPCNEVGNFQISGTLGRKNVAEAQSVGQIWQPRPLYVGPEGKFQYESQPRNPSPRMAFLECRYSSKPDD